MFKKRYIKWAFLAFILVYIGAATIPYIPHKEVNETYKTSIQQTAFYADKTGTERVDYIDDNTDALLYRLHMIEEAQNEIILSTFDFNADDAGKDMMAALLHAAQRNVKVKVIVDGISGFLDMRGNSYFKALASHENIEVKVYNSINLLTPWKLQARLHDKYVIVDDKMYVLGGRNTMNLFLGEYMEEKNIDRELFVYETQENKNASIHQLKDYFNSVWNLSDSKQYTCEKINKKIEESMHQLEERYKKLQKQYPDAYKKWNYEQKTIETDKITLLSNPIEAENKEPYMWYAITQLIKQGNDTTIVTPYIICGKEMYRDLTNLTKQKKKIDIITNDVASGANPWGCSDYLNQKKKIWNTGVQVYEYMGEHSSHTKALLIDDEMNLVGSYNMDMRSTYQDTELMLAVDSKELNKQMRQEVEENKTYSKTMGKDGEYFYGKNYVPKELGIGKKIMYSIFRIITVPIRGFL